MTRRPPSSTWTDTLFPYTALVRSQVVVAGLQRDVQGLAGRLHAAAQLAALGQCNRLAAVLVAVELDLVVLVKQRALAGQRQQRVDVVQALQRAAGPGQLAPGHGGRLRFGQLRGAACRARVWRYVVSSVVAESLQKQKKSNSTQ